MLEITVSSCVTIKPLEAQQVVTLELAAKRTFPRRQSTQLPPRIFNQTNTTTSCRRSLEESTEVFGSALVFLTTSVNVCRGKGVKKALQEIGALFSPHPNRACRASCDLAT
jgi:hypothetical protein